VTRPAVYLYTVAPMDFAPLVQAARTPLGPSWGDGGPAVDKAVQGLAPCLVECLRARAQYGLDKYAEPLAIGWPLATYGALQEALDLLVYLHADEQATKWERDRALELCERLAMRCLKQLQAK
jgi:hypothetical protein